MHFKGVMRANRKVVVWIGMGGGGVGDNKSSVSAQSSAKQQNHVAESFSPERSRSFTKTPKESPWVLSPFSMDTQ